LSRLEELAIESGYATVRLETGVYQPEAIKLYERKGFVRRGPFGEYTDDPLSLCYEKQLVS
jgi:putative acetyltransferase